MEPAPRLCQTKDCTRPRRVRNGLGRDFPVGAFSWACCSHCARGTHDVNGANVHSAACDALAVLLPPAPAPVPTPTPLAHAPSTMHATDALPAPPPRNLRAATGVCALAGCSLPVYDSAFDYCTASHAIQEGALAPLPAPGRGYAPLPAPVPVVPAGPSVWSSPPLPPASPFQSPPTDPLSRRLAALGRQDIEDALQKRAAAAAHMAPAAAPPPTPSPAPMAAPAPTPPPQAHSPAPAPPSPAPLPHGSRPRPSTARSRVGGGASAAVAASASARAALARAQSPPAHCSTPGCSRPLTTRRVDPATFFAVQVCCEPCGAAPPGAAATGGGHTHTRDCNLVEAARRRLQPPAACDLKGQPPTEG